MLQSYQKPLSGDTVGIVFGCYAPMHQGHLDVIFRAKKECSAGVMLIVCGYEGDRGEQAGIPLNKRYQYVRQLFAKDDLVGVYAINDTELGLPEYPNGWDGWLEEVERIYKVAVKEAKHRIWYVGEEDYKKELEKRGEIAILVHRSNNPISATLIRNYPRKFWDKITLPFRKEFSKNILITGTASEGKTTLVQDLSKYFNAPCSYEYGREYMEKYNISDWELTATDFIEFLQGQYLLNQDMIALPSNNGVYFADTDSLVTKMYAKYYSEDPSCRLTPEDFKKIEVVADEITPQYKWDKIFLVAPHGKFVDDGVRFMNHSEMKERKELFNLLCSYLKESGLWDKVVILEGDYYDNFINIVNYVKGLK